MADQPWFKFFAADYLLDAKVDAIPCEAEGLLIRMWCLCAREGSCPADPQELARRTLCPSYYVLKYQSYCHPFFDVRDGRLFSHRMEHERRRSEQARANVEKRYKDRSSAIGTTVRSSDGTTDRSTDGTTQSQSQSQSQKNVKSKVKSVCADAPRPTIEDVTAYCRGRGNLVDPQAWFDHYEANGWKVGKNPMKNWKAAVRTWEKNKPSWSQANGKDRAEQRSENNVRALDVAFPLDRGAGDDLSRKLR